jgi:hypothetical protein
MGLAVHASLQPVLACMSCIQITALELLTLRDLVCPSAPTLVTATVFPIDQELPVGGDGELTPFCILWILLGFGEPVKHGGSLEPPCLCDLESHH